MNQRLCLLPIFVLYTQPIENRAKVNMTSDHNNNLKQNSSQQKYDNDASKSEQSETREILAQFEEHDDQHIEQSPGPIEVVFYDSIFRMITTLSRSQSR